MIFIIICGDIIKRDIPGGIYCAKITMIHFQVSHGIHHSEVTGREGGKCVHYLSMRFRIFLDKGYNLLLQFDHGP